MSISKANRLTRFPPYLFAELDQKENELLNNGVDVIKWSVGDNDIPTPNHIVEAGQKAMADPTNHQYPDYPGKLSCRQAVCDWYKNLFDVTELDPKDNVIILMGDKTGLARIYQSLVNPGDITLNTSPTYPVPRDGGTKLSDGAPFPLIISEENNFIPELESIPNQVARDAKILYVNYPHNPTGKTANKNDYEYIAEWCNNTDTVGLFDEAYKLMTYYGYEAPTIASLNGFLELPLICVDSLSKTYNMTGWRIGHVVGNKELISYLGNVKTQVDSGVAGFIQDAATEALTGPQDCVEEHMKEWNNRLNVMVDGMNKLGIECEKPKATFYVWFKVPEEYTSTSFAERLLQPDIGIVCGPGPGFGDGGEGYIRFVATRPYRDVLEESKAIETGDDELAHKYSGIGRIEEGLKRIEAANIIS